MVTVVRRISAGMSLLGGNANYETLSYEGATDDLSFLFSNMRCRRQAVLGSSKMMTSAGQRRKCRGKERVTGCGLGVPGTLIR